MQKLELWIEKSGKTQEQIAADLGVTQGSVSRWCAGEAIPRPEMMQKIVEYTGGEVQPNDFYEGE